MKSLKNFAIGLTTVATLGSVTAAVASQPIGPDLENIDPEKAEQIQEVHDAVQAGDMELAEQLREEYGLEDFRRGGPGKRIRHAWNQLDDETKEAVDVALSNGDYTAFITAVGEDKADKITEERFAHMVEVHQAMEDGDTERLKELHEEMKAEMDAKREEVKAALDAGDYNAFIEALGEHVPEDLTEEKFGQMVEVHELRAAGETEEAAKLAREYGLKRPGLQMKAHRGGFGDGEGRPERGPGNEVESTPTE